MKIGDYVRVLRGTEEGHIVRFLQHDLVEIETSDGFTIPVPAGELVSVSPEESMRFGGKEPAASDQARKTDVGKHDIVSGKQETMLALVPEPDGRIFAWLSNATSCSMLYSLYFHEPKRVRGICSGTISPGQQENIAQFSQGEIRPGTLCIVQAVFHPASSNECPGPVSHRIRIAPLLKHGQKTHLDALNKKGYGLHLLEDTANLDADALRNSLLGAHSQPAKSMYGTSEAATSLTVDLHIESLTEHPELLTSEEIFELQLHTFEKVLDKAIAGNVKSIKFIHGVGNGTLRHRIHKRLSALKDILYYKDSDKERFGFGATTIELK